MYELPPILQGDEQAQLTAIRDYLVRMAQSLDTNVEKVVIQTVEGAAVRSAGGSGGRLPGGTTTAQEKEVDRLRSLIVKTADNIQMNIDKITTFLQMSYLAESNFGTYSEYMQRQIEDTAQSTIDYFNGEFTTLRKDMTGYMETVQGEIRRGYIEDPDNPGHYILGIAIAQRLRFTDNTLESEGLTYYELAGPPNDYQTFGFYTSTGWQYWIDGVKVGWFQSGDSSLHVRQAAIEQSLTLGGGWLMTHMDGFGIRYVGTST